MQKVYRIYIDHENPKKYFSISLDIALQIPLIKMALIHSTSESIEAKFHFYNGSTVDTWEIYLSYINNGKKLPCISYQQFSDFTKLIDQLADFEFYSKESIKINFPPIDSLENDIFMTMSDTALEYYIKIYLDNVFTKEYHRPKCNNIHQITLWNKAQKWKNLTSYTLFCDIKDFSTKLCNEFGIQDTDNFVLDWKKSLALFDKYEICPPYQTTIEYLETLSNDELVTVHNAVFRFHMFPKMPTCKCSQWKGIKMERWRNFFSIKPGFAEYLWETVLDRKELLAIGNIFPGDEKYNTMMKKSYKEMLNMIH